MYEHKNLLDVKVFIFNVLASYLQKLRCLDLILLNPSGNIFGLKHYLNANNNLNNRTSEIFKSTKVILIITLFLRKLQKTNVF